MTLLKRKRRRAVVLIELALLTPFLFLMFTFMIDCGRLFLAQNLLSDVSFSSARAGSITGQPGTVFAGDVADSFKASVAVLPLDQSAALTNVSPQNCTNAQKYVTTAATVKVDFITPGLGKLLSSFNGSDSTNNSYTVNSRGIALCEVVRG